MSNDIKIIIHCSASEFGHALMIDKWHREKGWNSIGYHYVICNGYPTKSHIDDGFGERRMDGGIEYGRTLDADDDIDAWEVGAHAYGYNKNTVAICLIGDTKFTLRQLISTVEVIKLIQFKYHVKTSNVLGHCELPGVSKTCPNLDMDRLRKLVLNKSEGMRLMRSFDNVVDTKKRE